MITSDTAKYISKDYAERREECACDKTQFTTAEQEFLEVSSTPCNGEADREEEAMKYESSPIDPLTTPKTLDVRDRPEVGH